jgi:DNA-binding HxlR family transcriptional regulator
MRLISGAWTAHVIWFLREGERCFTELRTDLAGISPKVLTDRLRTLQSDGVIERISKPTSPPTVWYSLTPVGYELADALVNVASIAGRLKRESAAPPVIMRPEA